MIPAYRISADSSLPYNLPKAPYSVQVITIFHNGFSAESTVHRSRFAVHGSLLGGCPEHIAPPAPDQHISPISPMGPIRSHSPSLIPTPDPQRLTTNCQPH